MKRFLFIGSAILLGLILAFVSAGHGAFANFMFSLGLYDSASKEAAVEESVRRYNGVSARFYSAGGELEGLATIPATPLLKRRLFKDITMLRGDGLVMVFDLDRMAVEHVEFPNRIEAVAHTSEVWAVALQDFDTREPVLNVKAIEVSVRYHLYRVPYGGGPERWVVYDVDVYPRGADIPPFERGPAL